MKYSLRGFLGPLALRVMAFGTDAPAPVWRALAPGPLEVTINQPAWDFLLLLNLGSSPVTARFIRFVAAHALDEAPPAVAEIGVSAP